MPQDNPKIGVWGLGRDGEAAARHLLTANPQAELTLLSDNEHEKAPASLPGIALVTGDAARAAISEGAFDVIVKSPGVPIIRPEIAAGTARGTRFTSGTNLWFDANSPKRTVAVTGTKGKSTTSLLLHHIALAKEAKSQLLGNGGVPALAQKPGEDLTVLELSSYQCADLAHGPDYAVFTNLFPEHVPWHGSVEEYYEAKLRLAAIGPETCTFANARDARLKERLAAHPNVVWFNGEQGYAETNGALTYDGTPVRITGTVPRGDHNIGNLAGAASVALAIGLIDDPLVIDLGTFGDLPHRLEVIELPQGITAIDDSISTIPEATMAAIALFPDRRIHAILGGSDRGQDYSALAERLGERGNAHAYLLPITGERIATDLASKAGNVPSQQCANLDEAIASIKSAVMPGDVILLSPAAPSHSQYANFEERGRHFQSLIKAAF